MAYVLTIDLLEGRTSPITFVSEGRTFRIHQAHGTRKKYSERMAEDSGRAFVYFTDDAEEWQKGKYPVPPAKVKGVDPENDRAYRKYNRGKLRVLRAALGALASEGLLEIRDLAFSWNAGCSSCPCSPGFTFKTSTGQIRYVDVQVSLDPPGPEMSEK